MNLPSSINPSRFKTHQESNGEDGPSQIRTLVVLIIAMLLEAVRSASNTQSSYDSLGNGTAGEYRERRKAR